MIKPPKEEACGGWAIVWDRKSWCGWGGRRLAFMEAGASNTTYLLTTPSLFITTTSPSFCAHLFP